MSSSATDIKRLQAKLADVKKEKEEVDKRLGRFKPSNAAGSGDRYVRVYRALFAVLLIDWLI